MLFCTVFTGDLKDGDYLADQGIGKRIIFKRTVNKYTEIFRLAS
jgi:hypothetical protein